MKAYFFVITPANYLYALQASKDPRFNFKEKHLIVLSDYHRSLIQFNTIINKAEWDAVYFPWKNLDRRKKSTWRLILLKIMRHLTFTKIKNQILKTDIVFWGNVNHSNFKYVKNYFHDIYLLDDGFSTVNISEKIEKLNNWKYKKNSGSIKLYTLFNLKSSEIEIIKHQFDEIKRHQVYKAEEKHVFFIGQPLVFNQIVSQSYYVKRVDEIIKMYESKGFNCFYLPHRSTTRNYIPHYWSILEFDFPLEYFLEMSNFRPEIFATFYSTGAYNLIKYLSLDTNNVHFWKIEYDEINASFRSPIKSIYSYLSENNFDIKN